MRSTRILSVSLPPDLVAAVERVAKREGRTRSELVREALRRYVQDQRWQELQRYGASRARRQGLTGADAARLVEAHRRG
jgi:CopG family transcriptional regulator/antitoxin EndoAI